MSPEISVILPTLKNVDKLEFTVESILHQSNADLELLIVDLGSSDGSKSMIEGMEDSRIRKIFLSEGKSLGYFHALNVGIKEAKASLISIACAGDIWKSSKLESQKSLLDSDPSVGAVFSSVEPLDGVSASKDDAKNAIFDYFRQVNRSRTRWIKQLVENGNCLYHSSAMIRSDVFAEIGSYDEFYRHLADYEFMLRVLQSYEIFVIGEATVSTSNVVHDVEPSISAPSQTIRKSNERGLILKRFFESFDGPDFAASFYTKRSPGDEKFSLALEKILYLVSRTNEEAPLFRDIGISMLRELADDSASLSRALGLYGLSSDFPHLIMGLSSPWFERCASFSRQERMVLEELSGTKSEPLHPELDDLCNIDSLDGDSAGTSGDIATFNLVILDDTFPLELSAFRYEEFNSYLREIKNAHVLTSGAALPKIGIFDDISDVIESFRTGNPELGSHVSVFDLDAPLSANLAYCIFLYQVEQLLPYFEKNEIPFVFTLYPGGGFRIDEPECKERIAKVCSSKLFRGVITTQRLVTNYLVDNSLCSEEKITEVVGLVLPSMFENSAWVDKRLFGIHKTRIDIGFVAYKYTSRGEDKGYDLFIECAKRLVNKYSNLVFHVIGGFRRDHIDVTELGPSVKFHGPLSSDQLHRQYMSLDIILSPNRGIVRGGQFDGFPTGSCIAAGLSGVAVFCTDLLGQNLFLKEDSDFVKIDLDPDAICSKIEKYVENPTSLYWLARNGQDSFKKHFSLEKQMPPRLELISSFVASGEKAR